MFANSPSIPRHGLDLITIYEVIEYADAIVERMYRRTDPEAKEESPIKINSVSATHDPIDLL